MWIWQGSEYARVLNLSEFWISWVSPGHWIWLNVQAWILNRFNMSKNARIFNTNLILILVVSLRSQFDILEKSAKTNLHCFLKRSIRDSWHGQKYASENEYSKVENMGLFLNMPGFSIYQGSEYARILNVPVLLIFEGCEYTIVPIMRGFSIYWICTDLWMYLNISG